MCKVRVLILVSTFYVSAMLSALDRSAVFLLQIRQLRVSQSQILGKVDSRLPIKIKYLQTELTTSRLFFSCVLFLHLASYY